MLRIKSTNRIIAAISVSIALLILFLLENDAFSKEPEYWPSYYVLFCFNVPKSMAIASDETLYVQFIQENTQRTSEVFAELDWTVPTKKSVGIDACVLSPTIGAVSKAGKWIYRGRMCKASVRGMDCAESNTIEYTYPSKTKILDFAFK